jgi:hypothetical protein
MDIEDLLRRCMHLGLPRSEIGEEGGYGFSKKEYSPSVPATFIASGSQQLYAEN